MKKQIAHMVTYDAVAAGEAATFRSIKTWLEDWAQHLRNRGSRAWTARNDRLGR